MQRKIPLTMFSQHPDHARKPYWHNNKFIQTHDELKECFLMYKDFAAQEVMWDWEGKWVDESVVEKLLSKHQAFFEKNPLGKNLFLTFRIPNPRLESAYRLGRAFMVILSAQDLANRTKLANPLFEAILPMVENSKEIVNIHTNFNRMEKHMSRSFGNRKLVHNNLQVIPLFENIKSILNSGKIIEEYAKKVNKKFGIKLSYIRPFCARSDPALTSGIIPATLAIKWALSEYSRFSDISGISTHPIVGPGALQFRGGLNPNSIVSFLEEFPGIKTLVIQSAFRYDYAKKKVIEAIKKIHEEIPKHKTQRLSQNDLKEIKIIIPWFEKPYKKTVKQIAPIIEKLSKYIPQRRERVKHVGLFGYSRLSEKVKLPRAIGFTACCYSVGLPPELFGAGKGLKRAIEGKKIKIIESLYKNLKPSFINAGRYLRKESIKELGLYEMLEDIKILEKYLGVTLGPRSSTDKKHNELVSKIISKLKQGKNPTLDIEEAAMLRKSIG